MKISEARRGAARGGQEGRGGGRSSLAGPRPTLPALGPFDAPRPRRRWPVIPSTPGKGLPFSPDAGLPILPLRLAPIGPYSRHRTAGMAHGSPFPTSDDEQLQSVSSRPRSGGECLRPFAAGILLL